MASLTTGQLVESFGVAVQDHVGEFGGARGGDFAVLLHPVEGHGESIAGVARAQPGGFFLSNGVTVGIAVGTEEDLVGIELEPLAQPSGERACGNHDGLL